MDEVDRHTRLEAWFRADADRILAYLLHRTDPDTAQDVLQEVFVIAYRKAEVVPDPPTGWLFGTARRVLANATRGQRRRDQLMLRLSDAASLDTPARRNTNADGPDDVSAAVQEALAGMSSADREVLTISAWYELSTDEAARALDCSRSAYNVRLHRARRRFAERLRGSTADDRSEPADTSADRTRGDVRDTVDLGGAAAGGAS